MTEMETYMVLAVVTFFSSFFGNILGFHITRWYEDRMFNKAFEPIYKRRANE